jgi:hypothetical protein
MRQQNRTAKSVCAAQASSTGSVYATALISLWMAAFRRKPRRMGGGSVIRVERPGDAFPEPGSGGVAHGRGGFGCLPGRAARVSGPWTLGGRAGHPFASDLRALPAHSTASEPVSLRTRGRGDAAIAAAPQRPATDPPAAANMALSSLATSAQPAESERSDPLATNIPRKRRSRRPLSAAPVLRAKNDVESPAANLEPDETVNDAVAWHIDKSTLTLSEPRRYRDHAHLEFVSSQPCLLCGRRPSDAHHLRFAQPQALGRRVSDEFVVPPCRTHHRVLHDRGDEAADIAVTRR